MAGILERIGNFLDKSLQEALTPSDQRDLVARDLVRQQLDGSDEKPRGSEETLVPPSFSLSADPADMLIGISSAAVSRQQPSKKPE